ncbi:MAG: hypothetical protein WBP41_11420, partial [Saprospiraceae bacterium]
MKKIFILIVFFNTLSLSFYAQYVGIGTETPTAMLDINGDVVFRTADIVVADSITLALDLNSARYSSYRISGADSAFTIAGITAGMDGRIVTLINESEFPMELVSEDSLAVEADRILTGDHENLILDHMGTVSLQYDTSALRWIVNSSNQMPAGANVWDTTGTNIFFDHYVGIGTDQPNAPLSIETDVNEIGFSHMAGPDSITVASSISAFAGAVGTTTNNIFSLKAGGQGLMHIMPSGKILIGGESNISNLTGGGMARVNDFDSKLTVITGLSETGYLHVGTSPTDQVEVEEAIGGVSAAMGTKSNHAFRLMTNRIGRLHILEDGRITISPNYFAPKGQLTVYQAVPNDPNNNGITVVTPNNTNGVMQIGGEGQQLAMRIGGSSGSIGTWTPHIMRIVANGTAAINIDPAGNVAIGIADPLPGYKVSINGNVKAKELVIETTGWPDYVFADQYKSLPLRELEKFIQQHHHLPNITSA